MSGGPAAARHTVIAHSLLKMRELRLEAARELRHGLQIMTFEQLAARLAGGLAQPVDDDALREAITAVLPETALGELDGIKGLPGMVGAAADTGDHGVAIVFVITDHQVFEQAEGGDRGLEFGVGPGIGRGLADILGGEREPAQRDLPDERFGPGGDVVHASLHGGFCRQGADDALRPPRACPETALLRLAAVYRWVCGAETGFGRQALAEVSAV